MAKQPLSMSTRSKPAHTCQPLWQSVGFMTACKIAHTATVIAIVTVVSTAIAESTAAATAAIAAAVSVVTSVDATANDDAVVLATANVVADLYMLQ